MEQQTWIQKTSSHEDLKPILQQVLKTFALMLVVLSSWNYFYLIMRMPISACGARLTARDISDIIQISDSVFNETCGWLIQAEKPGSPFLVLLCWSSITCFVMRFSVVFGCPFLFFISVLMFFQENMSTCYLTFFICRVSHDFCLTAQLYQFKEGRVLILLLSSALLLWKFLTAQRPIIQLLIYWVAPCVAVLHPLLSFQVEIHFMYNFGFSRGLDGHKIYFTQHIMLLRQVSL